MTRKVLLLVAFLVLVGCIATNPTVSPPITPVATPASVASDASGYSLVSVHIGNRPQGLDDFLEVARPTVIYSLNNSPQAEIDDHSPNTLLVRRIQNDTWGRLPDAMYQGLFTDHWESDARASARYEALTKTIYVPGRGHLNYVQYVQLGAADYYAPMNEPVLGADGGDAIPKAQWLNAWTEEWLTIIHSYGLRGCIFSFPTGEPPMSAVPYLAGAARMAAENGDIIDIHAYGVEGPIMSSPSSGAFWFVRFHDALPVDARPRFLISEFSAGNGYDTGLTGWAWIADSLSYGMALRQYPYVIGATAFQLDLGAESNIPVDVLQDYGHAASQVDWLYRGIYLHFPLVLN